ncbi:hypothetical protein CDAR_124391 [Caerostris darwini]|uniref:Uncharacterized protein n=1 Tax=Caerostris darwini TaxID=1538125 RepID=A0AAV4W7W5_9ARAC|nr:hypothetical protein CDAR_124391 [Caerostris darwini]
MYIIFEKSIVTSRAYKETHITNFLRYYIDYFNESGESSRAFLFATSNFIKLNATILNALAVTVTVRKVEGPQNLGYEVLLLFPFRQRVERFDLWKALNLQFPGVFSDS